MVAQIGNIIPFNISEAMDTGFFDCGTSQSGKTNLAKWQAEALTKAGVTVYVLDTSQAWSKNTPISNIIKVRRERKELTWKGSTVFDMSSMSIADRVTFTNTFCKTLYEKHVIGYRQPEFVIFEEAQTYLPNGCLRLSTRRQNLFDGVLDLVTVGANYKLRFGLITQFPAMVDKAPVKITMQRYFGLTWERNDINYIRALIGKEEAQSLRDLEKGEFVYQYKKNLQRIKTPLYRESQNVPSAERMGFIENPTNIKGWSFDVAIRLASPFPHF